MWEASSDPIKFQSTPPAREATPAVDADPVNVTFQSTPPAREATPTNRLHDSKLWVFQSTPPAREATHSLRGT